ncbi:hypothetical protein PIB30_112563, partial [Stylosanthes scabra]|nr:hypothetical protein [Stylosanthes scabra]
MQQDPLSGHQHPGDKGWALHGPAVDAGSTLQNLPQRQQSRRITRSSEPPGTAADSETEPADR